MPALPHPPLLAAEKAPAAPAAAVVAGRPEPPAKRRGMCRICREQGSETRRLIKPCDCNGTCKWVHVDCLDTWRAVGPGTAAMQCQICLASYQLGIAVTRRRNGRVPDLWHRFAKSNIYGVLVVQLFISLLGMLVRAFDRKEWLVRLLRFEQLPGYEEPDDFLHVCDHKITYYVAGLCIFMLLLGVHGLVTLCTKRTGMPAGFSSRRGCVVCLQVALVSLLIVVGSFIVAGPFTSLVLAVTYWLKLAQDYAKFKSNVKVVRQYYVKDLADEDDLGEEPEPIATPTATATAAAAYSLAAGPPQAGAARASPARASFPRHSSAPPVLDFVRREQQASLARQLMQELTGISGHSRLLLHPASRAPPAAPMQSWV